MMEKREASPFSLAILSGRKESVELVYEVVVNTLLSGTMVNTNVYSGAKKFLQSLQMEGVELHAAREHLFNRFL